MFKILIDTALLAVPNYAGISSDADELIDRIAHFSQLALPEIPIQMTTMDNLEELLWGNGIGPDFENIQSFLDMMELSHIYSAQDVFQQYTYLLEATSKVNESCSCVVTAYSEMAIDPKLPDALFPSSLRAETEKVLVQLSLETNLDRSWKFGSSLVAQASLNMSVRAIIDGVMPSKLGVHHALPLKLTTDVRTFHGLSDLLDLESAEQLWADANDEADLYLAVILGAVALRSAAGKDIDVAKLSAFRIGTEFLNSLMANQSFRDARYSKTTGRICMEVVADCFGGHVSEMGKPKQTKRIDDDGLAYRLHVSSGGLALRLMYWKTGSVIEFANVGPKHELVISRGNYAASHGVNLAGLL